jgi:pimeloyl-ACP methyl ester carboxylesterase
MTTQLPECHPFKSAEARERYLAHYDELAAAWPLESEVLMVETAEGTTMLRAHGPEGAPPLFLLNGTWCNSLTWSPAMIAKFAKTHRTYTLDNLYDFGRSIPARPGGGAADHNAWLDGVFDALGLTEGVGLFGISRGAWIAAEYTLHAPRRVAKSIWLSPALVIQRPGLGSATGGFNSLAVMVKPTSRNVAALMRGLMPAMERRDKQYFDRFVDEMVLGLQCFSGLKGASVGPRTFSDDELAGINTPVLCMVGETETMYSVEGAMKRLARVAPQIESVVFPGAGHELIDAQMEAMSDRAIEFLSA